MAKAGDKSTPTPDRMPLQEAIKHFGSFAGRAASPADDSIPARHSGLYTLDGRPYQDEQRPHSRAVGHRDHDT